MGIETVHPDYTDRAADWEQLEHAYAGQRTVKSKGTLYLPATSGMTADGMGTGQDGLAAYTAYLLRAAFPDFIKEAINRMVGVMHREESVIELPAKLEPMRKRATADGESLGALLRRVNLNQLLYGRYGLLLEAPDGEGVDSATPFFAPYSTLRMRNWDVGPRTGGRREPILVVLDESGAEREDGSFDWDTVARYRVLSLTAEGKYGVAIVEDDGANDPGALEYKVPAIGGTELDSIPFAFVNANDLTTDVTEPPMLGLSDLAMTVYRGQADYRQALFMQGQETLVVIGVDDDDDDLERVGANYRIDLPIGGDAKYVGVSAAGLSEMRQALENDKDDASVKGAQLLADKHGERQSGEALHVRVAASTATLASIAITSAEAVENLLKVAAEWVGADPDEVKIVPNTDFIEEPLDGHQLLAYMQARTVGAPLSRRSIHRLMRDKDLTDMTYDEEIAQLEEELADEIPLGPEPGDDDDGPGTVRTGDGL